MARITPEHVHTNKVLTNVANLFKNRDYIGDLASTICPVGNKTDLYPEWGAGAWFRDEARPVAPGKLAPIISLTLSTTSFHCVTIKARTPLEAEVRANADSELGYEARLTELVTDSIQRYRERVIGGKIFTAAAATTWTNYTTLAGDNQWSNATASDPLSDLVTAQGAIEDQTGGMEGNTFIVGTEVWRKLMVHPTVRTQIFGPGGNGPQIVTQELFAKAFNFERVLVGKACYTAAKEGNATQDKTKIWGKNAWVGHINSTPTNTVPSALHTFRWFQKVRSWKDDGTETDWIEAAEAFDVKVTSADLGYYFFEAVA